MKRLILLCLFIGCNTHMFSQKLDLIVKSNGDSIACSIDSITVTHIYFEMKSQGNWVHTHANLEEVSIYKKDIINMRNWVFESGSSYMISTKEKMQSGIRKNAIHGAFGFWGLYGDIMLYYDRMIGESYGKTKISWWIRAGGGVFGSYEWGGGYRIQVSSTMLTGSKNNHLEFNLGLTALGDHSSMTYFPSVLMGYRYQKPGDYGLFRIGAGFPEGLYVGLGLCF